VFVRSIHRSLPPLPERTRKIEKLVKGLSPKVELFSACWSYAVLENASDDPSACPIILLTDRVYGRNRRSMSGSKSRRTKNSPQQPAGNLAAPAPLRKRHMQTNANRPENTVYGSKIFSSSVWCKYRPKPPARE
jgi:hypothetical protein